MKRRQYRREATCETVRRRTACLDLVPVFYRQVMQGVTGLSYPFAMQLADCLLGFPACCGGKASLRHAFKWIVEHSGRGTIQTVVIEDINQVSQVALVRQRPIAVQNDAITDLRRFAGLLIEWFKRRLGPVINFPR
jgi:hypothetical protein